MNARGHMLLAACRVLGDDYDGVLYHAAHDAAHMLDLGMTRIDGEAINARMMVLPADDRHAVECAMHAVSVTVCRACQWDDWRLPLDPFAIARGMAAHTTAEGKPMGMTTDDCAAAIIAALDHPEVIALADAVLALAEVDRD